MTDPIETLIHVNALVRSCGGRLTTVCSDGYWGVTLYSYGYRPNPARGVRVVDRRGSASTGRRGHHR